MFVRVEELQPEHRFAGHIRIKDLIRRVDQLHKEKSERNKKRKEEKREEKRREEKRREEKRAMGSEDDRSDFLDWGLAMMIKVTF